MKESHRPFMWAMALFRRSARPGSLSACRTCRTAAPFQLLGDLTGQGSSSTKNIRGDRVRTIQPIELCQRFACDGRPGGHTLLLRSRHWVFASTSSYELDKRTRSLLWHASFSKMLPKRACWLTSTSIDAPARYNVPCIIAQIEQNIYYIFARPDD
jgi:hypothetical protein